MSVLRHGCSGAKYYMNPSSTVRADEDESALGPRLVNVDENRPLPRQSPPCSRRGGVSPLVVFKIVLLVVCAIFALFSWQMGCRVEKESRGGE